MYGRDRGFTLLELLISLVIVSIIVLLVFGALRTGIRAWEKSEADIESRQRRRVVLDLVKRQLESIVLRNIKNGGTDPFFLKGDDKSLEFVSAMSLIPGNLYGMVYVKYIVQKNKKDDFQDTERLLFYEKNLVLLKEDEDLDEIDEDLYYELIPGAEHIRFEYFKGGEDESAKWQETWDPAVDERFPKAVKMILQEESDSAVVTLVARVASGEMP